MQKPLISICIPTYNRAHLLADSLESCINQSYKNIEIIVVSDGCTDSTVRLMKWFMEKDQRIKYFHREQNKGISPTRNETISRSVGEYICVFDSDDIMNKERLKKSLKALQDVDFVYTSYLIADENGRAQAIHVPPTPANIDKESIKNNDAYPHVTIVAKRECFEENPYREELKVNDDMQLCWDWYRAGYKAKRIKEPLMLVRRHTGSVSVKNKEEVDKITQRIQKEITNSNMR